MPAAPLSSRLGLALSVLVLLASAGCTYNGHRTFGATEKIVASDVNYVTKIAGTAFVSLGDAILAPAEMIADQYEHGTNQYHPDHKYLSYAGSRAITRSDMGLGYQWMASIWSLVAETIYLPVTGSLDLLYILMAGDTEPPPSETELLLAGY